MSSMSDISSVIYVSVSSSYFYFDCFANSLSFMSFSINGFNFSSIFYFSVFLTIKYVIISNPEVKIATRK